MEEREHSLSEIAKANHTQWLNHVERSLDIEVVINKQMRTKKTQRKNV